MAPGQGLLLFGRGDLTTFSIKEDLAFRRDLVFKGGGAETPRQTMEIYICFRLVT